MKGFLQLFSLIGLMALSEVPGGAAQGESSYEDMIGEYLPSLLRVDFSGNIATNDLGEAIEVSCRREGKSRKCSLSVQSNDGGSGMDQLSDSFRGYVEGILVYGGINIAGAILLIVGIALYTICVLFMLCCKKNAVHPLTTPSDQEKRDKKAMRRGVCAYGCLGLFTAWLVVLIIVGCVLGALELNVFYEKVPGAVQGVATIVQGEVQPVENLLVSLSADVAAPLLSDLNHTITAAVDFHLIRSDVESINASLYDLPDVKVLKRDLAAVNRLIEKTESKVNETRDHIDDLKDVLNDTVSLLLIVHDDLTVLKGAVDNISTTIDANLPALLSSVDYQYDLNGPGGRSPPKGYTFAIQNDLSEYATSPCWSEDNVEFVYTELGGIQDGSLEGQPSDIFDLQHELAVNADLYDAVDFNQTRQNLIRVKDIQTEFIRPHGLYDQFVVAISIFEEQLGLLNFSSLIAHIEEVFDKLDELDFDPLKTDVTDFSLLVNVGDSSFLFYVNSVISEIARVDALLEMLPPIKSMLDQLDGVNRIIYELPTKVSEMYDTVGDAVKKIVNTTSESVTSVLTDALDEIEAFNFTEYIVDINTAVANIDKEIVSFNMSSVVEKVEKIRTEVTSLNLTEQRQLIDSVYRSLLSLNVSSALLDSMELLASASRELASASNRLATEYDVLRRGYCTADMLTSCTDDSQCSLASLGSCTRISQFRCSGSQQSVDCVEDAECTSPNYCLADRDRAIEMRALLDPFRSGHLFGVAELIEAMFVIRNASKGDPADFYDYCNDVRDSIADADIDSYISDVQDLIDELEDQDFDDIDGTIGDARSTLKNVDTSNFNSTLDRLEDYSKKAKEGAEDALFYVDGVTDFLFLPTLLRSHLTEMSRSELEADAAAPVGPRNTPGGPGAVVRSLSNTFQAMSDYFIDLYRRYKSDTKRYKLHKYSDDISESFDRAASSNQYYYTDDHGALFYLLMLDNTTSKKMIMPGDPQLGTVTANKDGNTYKDGKYCVTAECFANTRDEQDENGVVEGAPLPTSLSMISVYLFIPVSIACLISIWVLMCPICTKKPTYRHCPATCLIVAIVLIAPPILFLTGLFFPMLIFGADVCTTGTNVASNLVEAWGDPVCGGLLGGNGTLNRCVFEADKLDIPVNIKSSFNGFLGECDPGIDPFKQTAYAVADDLEDYISKKIDSRIEETDKKGKIRKNLTDILHNAGERSAHVLSDFLRDTADYSINCGSVESILTEMKAPVCTWMLGPFAWIVACMYLAVWTIVCAILPGACLVQRHTTMLEKERRQKLLEEPSDLRGDVEMIGEPRYPGDVVYIQSPDSNGQVINDELDQQPFRSVRPVPSALEKNEVEFAIEPAQIKKAYDEEEDL